VNPPDMVESSSSKQGRRATEGRSSPAQSTAPELNGDEGVAFLVQEAVLKLKEAPGPTQRESGRKTEAGAAATAYQRQTLCGCVRDAEVASFYSRVSRRNNAACARRERGR
jgi:hypothetical protein